MKARVVVDAHEVEGAGERVPAPLETRERRNPEVPSSRRERLEERSVVEAAYVPGEKRVERMPRPIGCEVHHVVRHADGGARCFLAQDGSGLRVRREKMVERARRRARVGEAGRDLAVEKTPEEKDERLVEWDEEPHMGCESARRLPGEASAPAEKRR